MADPAWHSRSCLTVVLVDHAFSQAAHFVLSPTSRKSELLLQVLQDKKFQPIVATYTRADPRGRFAGPDEEELPVQFLPEEVGCLRRSGQESADRPRGFALLSLLRRFLGPMLGFLRANFILVVPRADNTEITRGEFNRNFTLFDRYVLDLSRDRPRMIDRRLAIALGVLLDTGENR